jgi:hypothetical protein
MTGRIPTRWITQMTDQLADAERRLALGARHLDAGDGGRALEEAYPGVMAAAMVKAWLADEAWRRQRTAEELGRLVREHLPSGFATLFEMRVNHRGFAGWRAEDARPLLDEARLFVTAVRVELERWTSASGA